jgi:hypothetical protein
MISLLSELIYYMNLYKKNSKRSGKKISSNEEQGKEDDVVGAVCACVDLSSS